jgi:hypothetical protein
VVRRPSGFIPRTLHIIIIFQKSSLESQQNRLRLVVHHANVFLKHNR